MSLDTIRQIIEDATEKAVRAGVPKVQVKEAMMKAEASLLNAYFSHQKAVRDDIQRNGTAAMAERWGITPRGVRKRMHRALNEIGTATGT